MSGFDLATAGDISMEDPSMAEYVKQNKEFQQMSNEKKRPDPFTISVLVLCVAGVLINVFLKKFKERLSIAFCAFNIAVLLLFRYIFLDKWDEKMPDSSELGGFIKISAEFVSGFWMVIISSFILLFLNGYYLWSNKKDRYSTVYDPTIPEPDTLNEV